jgi:hypothetical protein
VIVDLYQGCYQGQPLDPGDRILSFDAKPQINARHRLHPALPAAPGRPVRYEHEYNTRRPHRALSQAAPLRPLPDGVTDLDQFRVQRRDHAGGMIHDYHLVA